VDGPYFQIYLVRYIRRMNTCEPNLYRLGLLIECLHGSTMFSMEVYGMDCNTPCCVLGHYCARQEIQQQFRLCDGVTDALIIDMEGEQLVQYNHPAVLQHFGITADEAFELFGVDGCGHAQSATQAQAYLKSFIARHAIH